MAKKPPKTLADMTPNDKKIALDDLQRDANKAWIKELDKRLKREVKEAEIRRQLFAAQKKDELKFQKEHDALNERSKKAGDVAAKKFQDQQKAKIAAIKKVADAEHKIATDKQKAADKLAKSVAQAQEKAAKIAARVGQKEWAAWAKIKEAQHKEFAAQAKMGAKAAAKAANTPLDWESLVSPTFTVPQSKYKPPSFLNRMFGGGGPKAPAKPGQSFFQKSLGAANRGVDSLIETRDKVQQAQRGDILDKISMALKGSPGAVGLAAAASAATAAMSGLGSVLGVVKDAFMATWTYIDTKVLPTTSMLNRAIGATTPGMGNLRKEAMKNGLVFERLGLGFEHGAQTIKDLAVGLKTANIPSELSDTLVKVSEYAGVGAENTGRLARSFLSTGATTKDLGKTIDSVMADSAKAAKEFAVPFNLVRKEFGENIDLVQRWGTNNTQAFNRAIAKAHSYGLSIRQLEGTFGKALDTFETTSDVASKLNAAFGTNIDSVKLLGQNSDERMESIRKSMLSSGFVWDKASKFAKNLLISTLQLKDEEEGASIFGSQKNRAEALKRIAYQQKVTDGMKEWRNALGSLGMQLTSIEQLTRNLFIAIANVVAKLLGFNSGIDGTKKGVKVFEGFMDNLTKKINEFAGKIPTNKNGIGPAVIQWVDDLTTGLHGLKMTALEAMFKLQDLANFNTTTESSNIALRAIELLNQKGGGSPADWADIKRRIQESPDWATTGQESRGVIRKIMQGSTVSEAKLNENIWGLKQQPSETRNKNPLDAAYRNINIHSTLNIDSKPVASNVAKHVVTNAATGVQ
jgi:hypothetical protein